MADDCFGEAAKRRSSDSTANVECKHTCEFLHLDNDDIEEALKATYRLETERRIQFLRSLDLFDKWVQSDIKLLNASSRIVEYPPDRVIIKDMREAQEYSYFIMSGQCKVVRQIPVIIKSLPFGKQQITLAAVDDEDIARKTLRIDRKYEKIKNIYLVIQVLKEGSYFGVDEDIGKSSIVTMSKTEFLRIPRVSLQAQQRGSFFKHVNSMAMKRYPNRAETFKRYMIGQQWETYKKGLVSEIAGRKSARHTARVRDVPKCLMGKP